MTDPVIHIRTDLAEALFSTAADSQARVDAVKEVEAEAGEYHLSMSAKEVELYTHISSSRVKALYGNANLESWVKFLGEATHDSSSKINAAFNDIPGGASTAGGGVSAGGGGMGQVMSQMMGAMGQAPQALQGAVGQALPGLFQNSPVKDIFKGVQDIVKEATGAAKDSGGDQKDDADGDKSSDHDSSHRGHGRHGLSPDTPVTLESPSFTVNPGSSGNSGGLGLTFDGDGGGGSYLHF